MNMALARLLSWKSKQENSSQDPIEIFSSPAKMLERGVPEVMEEIDQNLQQEFPPQRRKDDDSDTDAAKKAPRWLLITIISLLTIGFSAVAGAWVSSVTTRQSEQEQRMEAAIREARARADTNELQRIQKLETQMDQIIGAVSKVVDSVNSLEKTLAIDQVSHAEQAKVTRALVGQLETLNANMKR